MAGQGEALHVLQQDEVVQVLMTTAALPWHAAGRPQPPPLEPPHRDAAVLAQLHHELGAEHGLAAADPDGATI